MTARFFLTHFIVTFRGMYTRQLTNCNYGYHECCSINNCCSVLSMNLNLSFNWWDKERQEVPIWIFGSSVQYRPMLCGLWIHITENKTSASSICHAILCFENVLQYNSSGNIVHPQKQKSTFLTSEYSVYYIFTLIQFS